MNIGSLYTTLTASGEAISLMEQWRAQREAQLTPGDVVKVDAEAAAAEALATKASQNEFSGSATGGMMSRNFVNAQSKPSRHMQAAAKARQAGRELGNSYMGMVESIQAEMGVAEAVAAQKGMPASQGRLNAISQRAYGMVDREKSREINEKAKENLEASRREIERSAQEAMAPKDAEGRPVKLPTDGTADFGTSTSSLPAAASSPEPLEPTLPADVEYGPQEIHIPAASAADVEISIASAPVKHSAPSVNITV